jgi:hypothetical protein
LLLAILLALPALMPMAPAETEPNDSFAQATLVDSDTATITGTLSQTDNVDMYKMTLNRTGVNVESVNATLTKTSSGGQVRLYIYDEEGYRLAWNATVSDTPVSSSVCAPYTGYVYIAVTAWVGASSYDYRLDLVKTGLPPAPGLVDNNNRPSEAISAADGFSAARGADSLYNAGDFFSVRLGAGPGRADILTVMLTAPATADLAVELFRRANSTLIGFSDSGDIFNTDYGANETLYFIAQESGEVDIRVWAEHGGGQYSIDVRVFRSHQDLDGDLQNATAITQDGSFGGNVSLGYDQDDYYSIHLRPDTTIDMTLSTQDYNAAFRLPNLNLHLLDPDQSYVNSSSSADPVEKVGRVADRAGTYWIRVAAGRDSAGSYVLTVATVQPPLVLDPEVDLAIDEDTRGSVDLATVFSDQKGRPLSFDFTPAGHLTLSLSSSGAPPKEYLDMIPDPDWNGRALIAINATNADGKVSTAAVNLTVRAVNDPPRAEQAPLNLSAPADQPYQLPVSVFALFSDIDGDILTYSVREPGPLTVAIDGDGMVTVTPPLYWSGTQTFRLVASDPANATAEVPVTLTVVPVNHAPLVAAPAGNITFPEHGNATVDLAAAFRDPDGDLMAFTALDNIMLSVSIVNGSALVSARDPHWFGSESITFMARDTSNATATLAVNFTVTFVNDPPYLFRPLQNQSIKEDSNTTLFNLQSYFRDPHAEPLNFTVTGFGPNISVNISADGWVTFLPAPDWSGRLSMLFSAQDPYGERASTTLNLTVEPVDDAPVLSSPKVSPAKGTTATEFTFTVVVSDRDSSSITVMLKAGRRSIVMERVSGDLASGAVYRVRTALPEGDNTFYFLADDGERTATTESSDLKVPSSAPDNTILYISLLALIIIVVALALAFSPSGGKERFRDEEE